MPATVGALDNDLAAAIGQALRLDRSAAAVFAMRFNWSAATDQFVDAISRFANQSGVRADGQSGSAVPEPAHT